MRICQQRRFTRMFYIMAQTEYVVRFLIYNDERTGTTLFVPDCYLFCAQLCGELVFVCGSLFRK